MARLGHSTRHPLSVWTPAGGVPSGTVGRAPVRMVAAAALCVAALSACTGTDELDARPPELTETVESTPDAPDAPDPTPAPTSTGPFDLAVHHITIVGMGNAEILGAASPPPDEGAAQRAANGARDTLAAFLNAQFVDEGTRFTGGPVDGLLTPRAHAALTDGDRVGLGQLPLPVARTVTGPATTRAQVLLVGGEVDAVTLTYEAHLVVVLDDGQESAVKQAGTLTFVPTEHGWRADAVEVGTELPELTP